MDPKSRGPESNSLAASVVLLGKALYPPCLDPRKGLKTESVPVALIWNQIAFLAAREIN